jgi:ParB family transcriptional regulator, chromosome partitioning protein
MLQTAEVVAIPTAQLFANTFSHSLYGDPDAELDGLIGSICREGILVPLVVSPAGSDQWEVISGHRRLACARRLDAVEVPCEIRSFTSDAEKRRAVLEYNRQRHKTFSQRMREADALESFEQEGARDRRLANLRQNRRNPADRRNSDERNGRPAESLAAALGLGGKDLFRQARAIWQAARSGDPRAQSSVALIDRGEKTIHAAYKDLRRRDRFTTGFRPTPYDVWAFRHDRAFGVPHPGSIPPAIVAHTIHYFTESDALVVDPMAGGGSTIDVCKSMGRRCLAFDIEPARDDIHRLDIRDGFPEIASGCDLIFCDPPYHTMLARHYASDGVALAPLADWVAFLKSFTRMAFDVLRPGGHLALLLANQTEKDLPAGHGYLDHAFLGYQAILDAGFLPQRRISCPMAGAYLPQHVQRARRDGRMLGQVRDLLVARKPIDAAQPSIGSPAASS